MNLTVFTKNDPCNGKPWKQWPAKPAPVRDDDTCLHVADLQRAMLIEDADRRICEALGFHAPVFYSVACELRHIYWDRRDPCLLYTSPSPRDRTRSRMPSSA